MQVANIVLSLAEDHGNTVPKIHVTVAEIVLLQAIHGGDAVREIEPIGNVKRTHREERHRLKQIYGNKELDLCIVEKVYPGSAARLYETFDELGFPDTFFKTERRISARSKNTDDVTIELEGEIGDSSDPGFSEMPDRNMFG